jgi:preprotein translocase subunit SecG
MSQLIYTPLLVVHVAVCFILIFIVLLQRGKGADLGAAFGGASSTVFGARGAESFLGKLTQIAAVVFMLTSLTLSYLSSQRLRSSGLEKELTGGEPAKKEQPVGAPITAAPAAATSAVPAGETAPAAPAAK